MEKEKGITLVSLVITIIILIILAGISINSIVGDNGIITKAKQAKENIEKAKLEEEKELNSLYAEIANLEIGDTSILDTEIIYSEFERFRRIIAEAITSEGVNTESSDSAETMAENIKKIAKSSSVVFVNSLYSGLTVETAATWKVEKIMATCYANTRNTSCSGSASGDSNIIYLSEDSDGNTGIITKIVVPVTASISTSNTGSASCTVELYDLNDNLLDTQTTKTSKEIVFSLFDYTIEGGGCYLKFSSAVSGKTADTATPGVVNGKAGVGNIAVSYIPLS